MTRKVGKFCHICLLLKKRNRENNRTDLNTAGFYGGFCETRPNLVDFTENEIKRDQ